MFCSQEQYTGIRLEHKSEVTQAIENAVNIFLARGEKFPRNYKFLLGDRIVIPQS